LSKWEKTDANAQKFVIQSTLKTLIFNVNIYN